jgi:hypothetical protein
VRQMFADDVAAGGAEDIADKEDIHSKSLHGEWSCAAPAHLSAIKLREDGAPAGWVW